MLGGGKSVGSLSTPRQRRGIVVEDPFAHEFVLGQTQPTELLPPSADSPPGKVKEDEGGLAVVLDCANIGWSFGRTCFSAQGLLLALRFFESLNIATTGFLPAHYARRKPSDDSRGNALMETEQLEQLSALVATNRITLVPSGCEDDLFILSHGELPLIPPTLTPLM